MYKENKKTRISNRIKNLCVCEWSAKEMINFAERETKVIQALRWFLCGNENKYKSKTPDERPIEKSIDNYVAFVDLNFGNCNRLTRGCMRKKRQRKKRTYVSERLDYFHRYHARQIAIDFVINSCVKKRNHCDNKLSFVRNVSFCISSFVC